MTTSGPQRSLHSVVVVASGVVGASTSSAVVVIAVDAGTAVVPVQSLFSTREACLVVQPSAAVSSLSVTCAHSMAMPASRAHASTSVTCIERTGVVGRACKLLSATESPAALACDR